MQIVAGGVRSAGAALILGPWARGFPARTPPDSSAHIPGDRFRGLLTSACGAPAQGTPLPSQATDSWWSSSLVRKEKKKEAGCGEG